LFYVNYDHEARYTNSQAHCSVTAIFNRRGSPFERTFALSSIEYSRVGRLITKKINELYKYCLTSGKGGLKSLKTAQNEEIKPKNTFYSKITIKKVKKRKNDLKKPPTPPQ
jgi:hypothetical protein